MANERLYFFKMLDKYATISEARDLNRPDVNARIGQIIDNSKSKRMTKDGFESGFQNNINEYCGSKGEYDRRIRELGLVEIGYDTKDLVESTTTGGYTNTESFVQNALELGIDLTGNEIEAIKTGEYFDASKVDLSHEPV